MSDLENRVKAIERKLGMDYVDDSLSFKDSGSLRPGTISPKVKLEIKSQSPAPCSHTKAHKIQSEIYDWKDTNFCQDCSKYLHKEEPAQGGKLADSLMKAFGEYRGFNMSALDRKGFEVEAKAALDAVLRVIDEMANDSKYTLFPSQVDEIKIKLQELL